MSTWNFVNGHTCLESRRKLWSFKWTCHRPVSTASRERSGFRPWIVRGTHMSSAGMRLCWYPYKSHFFLKTHRLSTRDSKTVSLGDHIEMEWAVSDRTALLLLTTDSTAKAWFSGKTELLSAKTSVSAISSGLLCTKNKKMVDQIFWKVSF